MPNYTKFLLILLFALFSVISQANNIYVCESTGNDNNLGRSETKPFKTYDKAIWHFNKLDAGGKLLFCRGDEFPATNAARLYNKSCRADKPCTIGSYGSESLKRPIILAKGIDGINFENSGKARPDGGYVVEDLVFISESRSHAGIRLFNDVDDLTINNVHLEGFNIGFYMAGSNEAADGAGSNKRHDRIVLKNSTIIKNKKQGMLGSCSDCVIENNHFENNGTQRNLDHNIYLALAGEPSKGMIVRNNTLYKSAIVDGRCQGVSFVGHGQFEDLLIENNIVKEDVGKVAGSCWGISIDPGYANKDESFKNITIRNNKVINVGNNAIGCASCYNVLIEGNEIIDEGKMITAGIRVPVRGEDSIKSKNIVIKNNKIILSHEGASGVWIGGENIAQVTNNEIHLPANTRSDCINRNQASLKIDISTNACKLHNGVAIFDELKSDSPDNGEEKIAENQPVDEASNEEEQDIVDNAPISEEPINQVSGNEGNSLVQEENSNQELGNNAFIEETEALNTVPESNLGVANTGNNSNNDMPQQSTTVSNTSENGNVGLNDSASSVFNSGPRNATGGGVSGGNSSKSRNSSTSFNDIVVADDVISYTSPEYTVNNISISSTTVETEQMDITNGSKMGSESSKYSVKVKDVIDASREDNSNIDITQCRAYTAGRCLMK